MQQPALLGHRCKRRMYRVRNQVQPFDLYGLYVEECFNNVKIEFIFTER